VSTGTLLSERAPAPARPGRFVDRGSVFAGYVGIGMAIVVVIAFALIIPVQTIVLLAAPLCGLIIGGYANSRSQRWRPMRRVFANAVWAGLVTGISIALMYAVIRLVFVFADTGSMPDGTTLTCHIGPDCTYQRYLHDPDLADDLAAAGITDGASFAASFLRDQVDVGTLIVMLTAGGSLVAAGIRSVRKPPETAVGQR
jgi:hypothetical protein